MEPAYDESCGKFSRENFSVGRKNATIEVIFVIGIPILCSEFKAPLNSISYQLVRCEWITRTIVQNKSFRPNNKYYDITLRHFPCESVDIFLKIQASRISLLFTACACDSMVSLLAR